MSDQTGRHTERHLLGLPRPDLPAEQLQELTARIERHWRRGARCAEVGTELFFPELGDTIPPSLRALCAGCPVRKSCLASAVQMNEYGVWAGIAERPRRVAARQLRAGVDVDTVLDQLLTAAAPQSVEPSHNHGHRLTPNSEEGKAA